MCKACSGTTVLRVVVNPPDVQDGRQVHCDREILGRAPGPVLLEFLRWGGRLEPGSGQE
ncbi:hypothetical protein [Streptomyces sp. NPDC059957]|uniref:hypothetical protein n=1 Tax=Streptomyces sp. NPDC059957 TaxID=3347016 RepID=UPI003665E339